MERMPSRTRDLAVRLRRGVVAVAAAAAIAVSACAAPGGGATTAPATQAPATAAPGTASGASLRLELGADPKLGTYLRGRDGRSLYIFTKDHDTVSTCNGDCAASWPPVIVTMSDDATPGEGVTGALGTITRDDGSLQLTVDGHPVYYFGGDKAKGDVNGQGIGEVWFLAGPDGAGLGMDAGANPSPTACGGRYCY